MCLGYHTTAQFHMIGPTRGGGGPKWTSLNSRAFVNTRLLVHKHVKISVDERILETTRPQKHVKFLEQYIP